MISIKNKNIRVYLFFILFLFGVAFIFFNETGVLKFVKLRGELKDLNHQIDKLQNTNKNLQAEIDSLQQKVPAKIEKEAREKFGMKRPNEKSIEVIER
jgi:cell division protein FtsL